MKQHTFTKWLKIEIVAAQATLRTAYEELDKVKFVEGPALEEEYMDKIGKDEQEVIETELECELLQEKKTMVQAAINRREEINEEEIDAKIDARRNELKAQLSMKSEYDSTENMETEIYNPLNSEEKVRLQELYHEIVEKYHPATNPDLSETQKQLFKQAQDAYRMKDLKQLELIYAMFQSVAEAEGLGLELSFELVMGEDDGAEDEEEKPISELGFGMNYTLAGEIYSSFQPMKDEIPVYEAIKNYQKLREEVMAEISKIRSGFPFIAKDVLRDPQKIEDYKADLAYRLKLAKEEQERRQKELREMIDNAKAVEGERRHG